jgi:rhodanese-related sulfurtransferase
VSYSTISVNDLNQQLSAGRRIDVIDVRTPAEFREVHATIARNVPLESLDAARLVGDLNGSSTEPLYVICRGGNRSRQACDKLAAAGCANLVNIEGGTLAWEQAGLPVVRGQKTISLERQVRIAAGFLTLLGAVLGFFVHPYFMGLSAFIGAGLMFAGITDSCGMAMCLAKMPWNQVKDGGSCCSA